MNFRRRVHIRVKSSAAAKALEERGIFECFAQAAGLNVRPDSITQPDPPDIRCEIEVLGPVGFELVQLDVGDELQRMKYLGRGPEFWEDALKDLEPEVLQRHRSTRINVGFESTANQALRRNAMHVIAAALSDLPEGAEGPLENLPAGLESADLKYYAENDGPSIFEISGSGVKAEPGQVAPSGIHLDRIASKIAKYPDGWAMRAELLAYARWGTPFSDQMHKAPQYLAERVPGGIFARGWIFELTSRRVVACAS